jgi:hypothetical protein
MYNYGLELSGHGLRLTLPWLDVAMNWNVLGIVLVFLILQRLDGWRNVGLLTRRGNTLREVLTGATALYVIWWGMWQLSELGLF